MRPEDSDSDSTLSESEDDFASKVFGENERFTNFKEFVKSVLSALEFKKRSRSVWYSKRYQR